MKYKLIIDKNADEEIIAIVHAPSSLTQQIEDLVCSYRSEEYLLETENAADVLKLIQAFPSMKQLGRNQLTFCESVLTAFDVLHFVSEWHIALLKFERVEPTLESLFMEVTQQ